MPTETVLIAATAVSSVIAIGALGRLLKLRAKQRCRAIFGSWPIPTVPLTEAHSVFREDSSTNQRLSPKAGLPPTSAATFIPSEVAGVGVHGGTSNLEAFVLASLAAQSRTIFEFGTCTGRTTWLLARNAAQSLPAGSSPEPKVHTLTLPPEAHASYRVSTKDSVTDTKRALEESAYTTFYYTDTPEQPRINQLFCDSKCFDERPYIMNGQGTCDMIFIDGSHAASYVASDSEKALKMLAPGGIILWHDYRGRFRAPGVFTTLNSLRKRLDLKHIDGTSLVIYQKPVV